MARKSSKACCPKKCPCKSKAKKPRAKKRTIRKSPAKKSRPARSGGGGGGYIGGRTAFMCAGYSDDSVRCVPDTGGSAAVDSLMRIAEQKNEPFGTPESIWPSSKNTSRG